MRGRLNVRLLLIVLAGTAVLGTTWYFVHRAQVNRKLDEYLAQATRAEEAEKYDRAARLLRAYVLARSDDIDARIRYGELLEKLARTSRAKRDALSVYEQVLRQEPERYEIRKRATELAVSIGLADLALNLLKKLRDDFPQDSRVLYLSGLCHEMLTQFEAAEQDYRASYEAETKTEAYVRRAAVLRNHSLDKKDEANKVIAELAEKLPEVGDTQLACALYLRQYPETPKTPWLHTPEEHLQKARTLEPERVDVLIASAQLALERAEQARKRSDDKADRLKFLEEARGYLKRGLDNVKHEKNQDLYLNLAVVETAAGQRKAAIAVLVQARGKVAPSQMGKVSLALAELYAERLGELDVGDEAGKKEVLNELNELFLALKKAGEDPKDIDFVRGLALVRQGLWYEGSGFLEKVRPLFTDTEKAVRIDLLLAICYGRLGDIDRQLLTYRKAVMASPLDYRPRHGLADSLAALGRSDEAVEEYRYITQMERSPPSAWLALARLMVYLNLSRVERDRRWNEVSNLLKAVKKATGNEVEVPLLEAEVLFAQGDRAGARKLLEERRAAKPKDMEFWCALATLTFHEGDPKAAAEFLDRAAREVGDSVELRIARLRITQYGSIAAASAVLSKVAAGAEHFPVDERVRLLRSLAAAYWLIGQPADAGAIKPEDLPKQRAAEESAIREAGRLWAQIAVLRPTELQVRLLQFDVALNRNDDAGMGLALEEIGRIEGGGPYTKYGEAARLIWRAVHSNDHTGLADARNLLAVAASRRGAWSRIPLAQAQIDDLEQNPEEEIKHLKDAVDLGDRQIVVIKRLVGRLNERERRVEADEVLRRLQAQAPLSNDLQRIAAEVSLQLLDMTRALSLAESAVDANSKDFKERVWLAEILSASGRWSEADKHFEAAIALAGDNPDPLPWTSLVLHTLRQRDAAGHSEAALKEVNAKLEKALARAEQKLGVRSPLALAACYDLAGKKDEAEAKYLAAIKADPGDVRAIRAVATFYQKRGSPTKAEPFLRQLLAAESKASRDDVAWARRNLALALGLRNENPDFDEAMRLLKLNEETVDDLRARAVVTATRPNSRQEVIALLERAEQKGGIIHTESAFLLAKLYEAEGNWPKAKERMLQVINLRKDNAAYIAAYVSSLIRRGDNASAEDWVRALENKAPNRDQTVVLQVEVLCRLGKPWDALPLIRKYTDAKEGTPEDPALRALVVADLFDRIAATGQVADALAAAEQYYVRHRTLSKEPTAVLPLAGFYARNNFPEKALALCDEARKTCPIERVLLAAVTSLALVSPGDANFARVEGWVNEALAKEPNSDNLQFMVAILREFQGKFADAEAVYRKILARSGKNVVAMNNLAFMLARTGRGWDALEVTRKATALTFNLRETQGIALLATGDPVAARNDLERAVSDSGSAVAHFHLAEVLWKLKDRARARDELRKAQLAGLRLAQLHPLERSIYTQLVTELKP